MLALPPPGSPARRLSSLFFVHIFHGWSDCQVPLKGSMAASSGNGVEEEEEKHASVRFVAVPPLRFKSVPHEAAPPPVLPILNSTAPRDSLYHAEKHKVTDATLYALVYALEFTLTLSRQLSLETL